MRRCPSWLGNERQTIICWEGKQGKNHGKPEILSALKKIAPTYAVRGNNDKEWAKDLPETLSVRLCGIGFFMVHHKKYIPKDEEALQDIDIIIYGHSHKYEQKYEGGRLLLNPGSCGPRRFTQPITYAVLTVGDDGTYHVEKAEVMYKNKASAHGGVVAGQNRLDGIDEAQPDMAGEMERQLATLDMGRIVRRVMRDTDKKVSVREIAAKNDISEELAGQICRLYLTHPSVSADEILDKMGLPKNR